MEISSIQPNCSECAIVVYSDKLDKKQVEFFEKFIKDENLSWSLTKKKNISITDEKTVLWELHDKIEAISKHLKLFIYKDKHYDLIRDESYYELFDEGKI